MAINWRANILDDFIIQPCTRIEWDQFLIEVANLLEPYHAKFVESNRIEFESEKYYTLWLLDKRHQLKN